MSFNDVQPNPYDQNTPDLTPETPPLDEVIRRAISVAIMKLRVHLPGEIVKIRGPQQVDIQPLLQTRYTNGNIVNLPVIQNVMVQMPFGKNYSIKLPIAVGDTGSLLFCDRSLDVWSQGSGGIVDPQDSRNHNLQDAVFIPGLVPFPNQLTDTSTDLIITAGKAEAKFQQGGTFVFTNGANELISLLDQITQQLQSLATTLSTDTVNTIFGPMKLNAFSTYQQIGQAVQELDQMLETLKGS
jgi:Phage protein Gp138 N-terminal domain